MQQQQIMVIMLPSKFIVDTDVCFALPASMGTSKPHPSPKERQHSIRHVVDSSCRRYMSIH